MQRKCAQWGLAKRQRAANLIVPILPGSRNGSSFLEDISDSLLESFREVFLTVLLVPNGLDDPEGVGELGTIGATPALVNAVADALARHGRGAVADSLQMPLTPPRIWALLQS
jgi:hypothetical protein